MKINFNPTRDWVVLPLQRKNKTESGIILNGEAEKSLRSNILEVIATGPDCQMVKAGDTVMVHPESQGLIITLEEGEFIMVNEFMLLGVISN